jgi:hypothetical protein
MRRKIMKDHITYIFIVLTDIIKVRLQQTDERHDWTGNLR